MEKIIIGLALTVFPFIAEAYVGPGSGITAIGSVLALLAAVLVGILGFVWYPIKRLRKKNKEKK